MGREFERMAKDGMTMLGRIAEAVEKMASDPQIEIEAGPPVCPSCGKLDPRVVFSEQEAASGPMSQIVVDGDCEACGRQLFIVIESYSVHKSRETAIAEILERDNLGFFGKGGNGNE